MSPIAMADDPLALLGTRDLRELLRVSDRQLRRLTAAGRLPRPDLKLGRGLRWRRQTIDTWLNETTEGVRV